LAPTLPPPRRDLLILLLAFAGAGVDAVVIIAFNVLTAAQTGNTILFAVALAQGQVKGGISAAVSVLGFVVGTAVGELTLSRPANLRPGRSAIASALLAECVLLGGVIILWRAAGPNPPHGTIAALIVLAALAMGIQSTVVLRLHAGPTTTYITGMLTTFTTGMIRSLLARKTPSGASPTPGTPKSTGDASWKYGLTWVVYTAGAIASGVLFLHVGEGALLVPITAVIAVAAVSRAGP